MLFNSTSFLVFFPIVVLLYFVIPKRWKNLFLLAASYYFYMCWSVKYILLIFTSTVVTYLSGLLMDKVEHSDRNEDAKIKQKKKIVAASFIINLSILFFFKYFLHSRRSAIRWTSTGATFTRRKISCNTPCLCRSSLSWWRARSKDPKTF